MLTIEHLVTSMISAILLTTKNNTFFGSRVEDIRCIDSSTVSRSFSLRGCFQISLFADGCFKFVFKIFFVKWADEVTLNIALHDRTDTFSYIAG